MQYRKEYRDIQFRVFYDINPGMPNKLAFAAHPYEKLLEMDKEMTMEPSYFLVKGIITEEQWLQLTFTEFRFEMDQDLHSRLGLLYERIHSIYEKVVLKRGA